MIRSKVQRHCVELSSIGDVDASRVSISRKYRKVMHDKPLFRAVSLRRPRAGTPAARENRQPARAMKTCVVQPPQRIGSIQSVVLLRHIPRRPAVLIPRVGSAPASSRATITAELSVKRAAQCRGVQPSSVRALGSAPDCKQRVTSGASAASKKKVSFQSAQSTCTSIGMGWHAVIATAMVAATRQVIDFIVGSLTQVPSASR